MPRRQRQITGTIIQQASGLYIRAETTDIYVESQQQQYKAVDYVDAIVLDLGGHIGSFARYAMHERAAYCISVEAYLPNCEVFALNCADYDNIKLINAAVVSSQHVNSETILYVSQTDTLAHSLTDIRGRIPCNVQVIKLEQLLIEYEPHVVKMDIEGAEYDLMHDMQLFSDYGVEYIAAELHLNLRNWRNLGEQFMNVIELNYKPINPAKIGAKNWNTTGVWELRGN